MKKTSIIAAGLMTLAGLNAQAQQKVDFAKDIQPLLEKACLECHGPVKPKGGLRLDTKEGAFKADGTIIAGKAQESELYKRTVLPAGHDDIMPPKGDPLAKAQTDLLKEWINQGATWPAGVVLVAEKDKKPGAPAPAAAAAAPSAAPSPAEDLIKQAAELKAKAAELKATAATLEQTASKMEATAKNLQPAAPAAAAAAVAKAPAKQPAAAPAKPKSPQDEAKAKAAAAAEAKAIAELEKAGFAVRPIAQNDPSKEAAFHLAGASVTDATIAPLKDIPSLIHLNLANTKITDAGLASIKGLSNLTRLHLEKTGITDAGLAHLNGLKNLTYLNLYNTGITDAGLEHLKGLKNLKQLYLFQTKVTDEGVEKLKKALPGVVIVRGWELEAPPAKAEAAK